MKTYSLQNTESTIATEFAARPGCFDEMREEIQKCLRLLSERNRFDRLRALFEIKLNQLCLDRGSDGQGTITFDEFLSQTIPYRFGLWEFLQAGGEAESAVQWARSKFEALATQPLPFPSFYNADATLALLSYALVRYLRPQFVIETGVGYGISSALVLLALDRNGSGELASIDLPSLADPEALYVGGVVPECLKGRWSLRLGSSRRCLQGILSERRKTGLFISDSANVYTLQRYEFESIYPHLPAGGVVLFNNIGRQLQRFLRSIHGIEFYSIWQIDKPGYATGLIIKR
jgi:hypothetical protein